MMPVKMVKVSETEWTCNDYRFVLMANAEWAIYDSTGKQVAKDIPSLDGCLRFLDLLK